MLWETTEFLSPSCNSCRKDLSWSRCRKVWTSLESSSMSLGLYVPSANHLVCVKNLKPFPWSGFVRGADKLMTQSIMAWLSGNLMMKSFKLWPRQSLVFIRGMVVGSKLSSENERIHCLAGLVRRREPAKVFQTGAEHNYYQSQIDYQQPPTTSHQPTTTT